jgi:tetratricopeptide (TPR) repeat protein
MIAWRNGDYTAAETAYTHALSHIRAEQRFQDAEAEVRYGLGLLYRQQGKYDDAQKQFERDLTLNRQLANRQNEARALNALVPIENMRGNFAQAITLNDTALTIRRSIGDQAGIGATLLNTAQLWNSIGDYGRAEPLLQEALSIQQQVNNRWGEILTWNEMGILYLMVGGFQKAQEKLEYGIKLSVENNNQLGQAFLYCNLGQVLREQDKLAEAQTVLWCGLRIAENQGDKALEELYWSDLAMTYLRTAHYNEAIEYATAATQLSLANSGQSASVPDLVTLAIAYSEQNNQAQAQYYVQQALLALEQADEAALSFPQREYWLCAQVLTSLGDEAGAEKAIKAAYHLMQERAEKISNSSMRESFLRNISYNRAILEAVETTHSTQSVEC